MGDIYRKNEVTIDVFEKIFKRPWPYITGAIILAVINIILLKTTGSPWKVTTGFLYIGAWILELIGLKPSTWYYFNINSESTLLNCESFINNSYLVINCAIIIGALLGALWASEFKIRKIKNKKQLFFALVGGILMGYGSRLSFGCNIGSYFSAIPSFSLHGWVFALFMFVGAWVGSKILIKYLL
ncbi:YeeE/YedE thiosulfate transporter family protein [Brassicibacter mesophilus]|uniref:YeeE/YedE thiosulfate transporter family protein n=1 Tax=Brassicibacter mesophilus TaxID=745119 RepID=UPI003D1C157C